MIYLLSGGLLILAFLAYARHTVALALTVALLPSYLLRFTVFNIPTTFLEAAIIIMAIMGIAQREIRQQWKLAWQKLPYPVTLMIGLFVFACVVSVMISPNMRSSLGILKGWALSPILLGWMVYSSNSKSKSSALKDKSDIIQALILSGIIIALLGLSQLGQLERIRSVYDVPASLALYLTPILTLTIWGVVHGQQPQKNRLFALIMAAALLATQSAGALAALLLSLGCGALMCARPHQRRLIRNIVFAGVMAAAVVLFTTGRLTYFARTISGTQPTSVSVRVQLWDISLDLIREHPLLGIGLGQFEPAYQKKLHERFAEYEQAARQDGGRATKKPLREFVFRDPHNWPLSFWLNTGIVGLLSFTALHVWIGWKIITSPQTPSIAYGYFLALLSLLLYGLVDTIYWKNDLAALHWTLLALVISSAGTNTVGRTRYSRNTYIRLARCAGNNNFRF